MAETTQQPLHEYWKDYTDQEIINVQKARCSKCQYKGKASLSYMCCDYFYLTGNRRETRPEFCEHYKDGNIVDRSLFGSKRPRKPSEISV